MMHMEHRLTQTQRQQLVLTQKMQQALQILQMSGMELEQHVQQELEQNPFLEIVQKTDEPDPTPAVPTTPTPEEDQQFNEAFDLDSYADRWKEGTDLSRNQDLDARRQYYENSITQEESLRAHLLGQLRVAVEEERLYEIGERIIIGDIDERGYFTGDVAEMAAELEVPAAEIDRALGIIRTFDPTGVGARDVVECLLLQIDVEFSDEPQLRVLVERHLEELKRRQIPQIAKAMKVSVDRVEQLKNMLATLNPWPGHQYASGPPQYVTPDVVVEKADGRFVVRLVNERLPEIKVNTDYAKQIREASERQDADYIRQKMEAARWLTRNIEQRQQTIVKVAQCICDFQSEFLEKGVEFIRPLTLQVIADEVGVHESTVARTTRGKYIQTPQGLFELKYFFSPGLRRDGGGEDQSSKSVMAAIKKILDEEDKRKPLSDQKIADMLNKQGLNIARRTVTKYREAMGILSTTLRRQYQS